MLEVGTNHKLKSYLSKKIFVQLIQDRKISGILNGYDQFLNLVLDDGFLIEDKKKIRIGKVLIRGDMVISVGNY